MTERSSGILAGTLVAWLVLGGAVSAETAKPQAGDASKDGTMVTNPFSGREDIATEGRTLFNVHCSHCHGPNAAQGERRRDLRRLKRRYRDDMPAVFLKTAWNGRPEKGMPSWREIFAEEELWKIFTFLETVQKK